MAKILVLDDDKDYCEEISLALSNDNHKILTASCPREAITLCIAERPDILISDWMLKESLDGLSAAEVMEVIQPELKIILITGFASKDLKENAKQQEVFALLEKPFSASKLREVVASAITDKVTHLQQEALPIGIFEVTNKNTVTYANSYAKKTLLKNSKLPVSLTTVINFDSDYPNSAIWHKAKSQNSKESNIFSFKIRKIDKARDCIIFLSEENHSYKFEPITQELLGDNVENSSIKEHLLIVDDFSQIRKVAAAILKDSEHLCHTAQNLEEAHRLFTKDKNIKYIIFDLEMNSTENKEFIRKIRSSKRDITTIGSCSFYTDETSKYNVDAFLPKPWSDLELLETVRYHSKEKSKILIRAETKKTAAKKITKLKVVNLLTESSNTL